MVVVNQAVCRALGRLSDEELYLFLITPGKEQTLILEHTVTTAPGCKVCAQHIANIIAKIGHHPPQEDMKEKILEAGRRVLSELLP